MRILLGLSLAAAASLTACGAPEPLIDRINVPDAKYNKDLAACRDQTTSGWLPFTGGTVAECMRGKGYHVLMNNSGL